MHRVVLFTWLVVCVTCAAVVAGQENRTGTGGASLQLIDDLVVANRILANEGILDGLGHISTRHDSRPDRFLLSRDLAPGLVTAADLAEYDLEGNPVNGQAPRGYQERFIHAAIYKARPDVRSVVHAHTPSVLTFAVSTIPLRPIYHMAAFLVPGVPMYEIRKVAGHQGMLVNDMRTGTALAQTLGDKPVALMRGHGFVAVGPNVPEAVSRAIFLDVNARVQLQAIQLGGTVNYLTAADVAPGGGQTAQPNQTTAYPRSWGIWKERAMSR
ncbi:MAG: class II aldolase/adducin family protein [Acidobacteria bacterium]|nr:class II aldolase/adducin family protein [Acidobacteriota bacterium]